MSPQSAGADCARTAKGNLKRARTLPNTVSASQTPGILRMRCAKSITTKLMTITSTTASAMLAVRAG